jgi:Fe-S-cluster containining protein
MPAVYDRSLSRTPDPIPTRRTKALPVAEPWYADGLRFKCTTCGNCCTGPAGYVWITPEEVDRLATHLAEPVEQVRRRYVRKVGRRLSLKERRNADGEYDCIFLKPLPGDRPGARKRGCSIYDARPNQCRTWPFWHGTLQSRDAWTHSKRTCPGLDSPTGKLYGVKEIEALRDADDWPDDPPSSV